MAHSVGTAVERGVKGGGWYYGEHRGSDEEAKARIAAEKGLGALEKYEYGVKGRKGDIAGYYDEQEALQGQEYDVRRRGVGLQQERLGLQGQQLAGQESQALTQFLGDAYSFRKQSDVEKATG